MDPILLKAYCSLTGALPDSVSATPITGSGSSRSYVRLSAPDFTPLIGVEGSVAAENRAFIHMANRLRSAKLPVPEVLWSSPDSMKYIVTDGGSLSLLDHITASRPAATGTLSDDALQLCCNVVRTLANIQFHGHRIIDTSLCHPVPEMSGQTVMWDLNYWKYCFLKPMLDEIDEPGLDHDFSRLTAMATDSRMPQLLQYRDFQSRNVMLGPDLSPTFIDFQGARTGMPLYDLASFIWQAKARFTPAERNTITAAYSDELTRLMPGAFDLIPAPDQLSTAATLRQLQTLGAYGFRGLVQGKPHFVSSITDALLAIGERVAAGELKAFPAIESAVMRCAHRWNQLHPVPSAQHTLTVTVSSFSYRRGYPADSSGNGGGFVFDCRGMHNPGRYDRFRPLTGADAPVHEFLEQRGECDSFVDNALAIVSPSVECYLRRGFTSLNVGFGCTGGRHRSVYCAIRFARMLAERYPAVSVMLFHREQPQLTQAPIQIICSTAATT